MLFSFGPSIKYIVANHFLYVPLYRMLMEEQQMSLLDGQLL